MRIKSLVWSLLLGLLSTLYAAGAFAADVVLILTNVTEVSSTADRSIAARDALRAYANAIPFSVANDKYVVQYASGLQERMNVSTNSDGQLVVLATSSFGQFAKPAQSTGGYGGGCNPFGGSVSVMETGNWVSWSVCGAGGCNTGSTWISTGYRFLQEAVAAESCYSA